MNTSTHNLDQHTTDYLEAQGVTVDDYLAYLAANDIDPDRYVGSVKDIEPGDRVYHHRWSGGDARQSVAVVTRTTKNRIVLGVKPDERAFSRQGEWTEFEADEVGTAGASWSLSSKVWPVNLSSVVEAIKALANRKAQVDRVAAEQRLRSAVAHADRLSRFRLDADVANQLAAAIEAANAEAVA